MELQCMYEGCDEGPFESHAKRTEHSLREHHDINPKKYPNTTDQDDGLLF